MAALWRPWACSRQAAKWSLSFGRHSQALVEHHAGWRVVEHLRNPDNRSANRALEVSHAAKPLARIPRQPEDFLDVRRLGIHVENQSSWFG
jgi:hypothetical protein